MFTITYLNASQQEKTISFDSYEEFERSQQSCLIGVADHYKVTKLTYKGHEIDYSGTYGDIFFFMMKQDLSQYED